jgi:tetratricopeptide (TPR) repeat protein
MQTNRPGHNSHDEFELMIHRAVWHKSGAGSALGTALECLRAEGASVNHRVEAGGAALAIADEVCDHALIQSIFSEVSNLWATNIVDNALRLRAEMIFHCVCGDLEIGVASAKELLCDKRANGDVSDLFSALLNAGAAFRTAGLFADSETSYREALSIAERHKLNLSASSALDRLAHLFLELGETEKVRECYALLVNRYAEREDIYSEQRVTGIAVRLALIDGRYDEALRLTRDRFENIRKSPALERRAHDLALIVAARLKHADGSIARAVTLLEQTHLLARVNGRQAFVAYTLYRGLIKVGRESRANELLNEYLSKYRREPWPPGAHLLESLPA